MKTCNKCDQCKPFEAFHVGLAYADGYRNTCKKCVSDHAKALRGSDPEYLARVALRNARKERKALRVLERAKIMQRTNSLMTSIAHATPAVDVSVSVDRPLPGFLDQLENPTPYVARVRLPDPVDPGDSDGEDIELTFMG